MYVIMLGFSSFKWPKRLSHVVATERKGQMQLLGRGTEGDSKTPEDAEEECSDVLRWGDRPPGWSKKREKQEADSSSSPPSDARARAFRFFPLRPPSWAPRPERSGAERSTETIP